MILNYKTVFSDRKTLSISVERDRSVIIRAPAGTASEAIDKIIEAKKLWLYEKINGQRKYYKGLNGKEFVSGESIMYLGKNYRLETVEENTGGIHFDSKFIISKSLRSQAAVLFRKWYIEQAKKIIIPKIIFYAKQIGVRFNKVLISDLRYTWGSCTPKDNLNFNWRLIKAPVNVINYVIVHELAHLRESNHTANFWNIVKIQAPQYTRAKEWLKEHGDVLERDF